MGNKILKSEDAEIIKKRIAEIIESTDSTEIKTAIANSVFANTVEFMPFLTGELVQTTSVTAGRISYNTPYAQRLYYGDKFNFTKAFHPLATARWLDVGVSTNYSAILNDINEAFRRNAK